MTTADPHPVAAHLDHSAPSAASIFGGLLVAAAFGALPVAASAQAFAPRWIAQPVAGTASTTVRVPIDRFTVTGSVPIAAVDHAATPLDAADGDVARWLLDNRPEVGSAGALTTAQTSQLARRLSSPVHWVVGRYAADRAELAIDVLRLERGRDAAGRAALVVSRAAFTPHHGARWAARRAYLTAAERQATPGRAGRNPFAPHAGGAADPLFHDIGAAAVQVALGHAMVLYRAPVALLATTALDVQVTQVQGGSWLRRRVTTTVDGHAVTRWSIGTPLAAQPWRDPVAVCVPDPPPCITGCTPSPCPVERVAASGTVFDAAGEGAFGRADEIVYSHSTTQSGWTVLAVGLLLDPGVFGTLALGAGLGGPGTEALTGTLGSLPTVDATALDTVTTAPVTMSATGELPLTAAQRGRFGSVAPATQVAAGSTDAQMIAMRDAAAARLFADPLGTGAAALPLATLPDRFGELARPTPQAISAATLGAQQRDAAERYRACVRDGYVGEALRRCAAGSVPDAQSP